MSQHFINNFIYQPFAYKGFNSAKISDWKVVKYQASNRKNNISPNDREVTHHLLKADTQVSIESDKSAATSRHIDIQV